MKRICYVLLITFGFVSGVCFAANRQSGQHILAFPKVSVPTAQTIQPPSEMSILALLVEFQEDITDQTTGNGLFDLSIPEEQVIDPPPHSPSYFTAQMQALSNYYHTVSKGKLSLDYHVYPTVLVMPHEMGDYNPNIDEASTNKGLAELFRDAILAADADGASFSDYDAFMVFHAGVGKDISMSVDFTPQDIPSAFLSLDDLLSAEISGIESQGIPVDGGSVYVKQGIVLPETESQEGYEVGLLGTMTLMFGFELGLPALWNTETGLAGIGRWGLMDQGSANFDGLIPAEPCAYTKVLLGWETPVTIQSGQNLKVACSQSADPNKIYKVPINDHEYYLIENRIYDFNRDSVTYGTDSEGRRVRFNGDYSIASEGFFGVIVQVDEYDFGLPGSGILIWHIDESVIEARRDENKVNADETLRGVDLEEADGPQDLGQYYGMLSGGAGSESGSYYDAWFRDNEAHFQTNQTDNVAFTPTSYPPSVSNSGANTHITIKDFSAPDTVMTFTVVNNLYQAGFPIEIKPDDFDANGDYHLNAGDLDGDGKPEIMINDADNSYTAVVGQLEDSLQVTRRQNVIVGATLMAVTLTAVADLDGDGSDDVVIAYSMGETGLALVAYSHFNEPDLTQQQFLTHLYHPVKQLLIAEHEGEKRILILQDSLHADGVTITGIIKAFDADGQLVWSYKQENQQIYDVVYNDVSSFFIAGNNGSTQLMWDGTGVDVIAMENIYDPLAQRFSFESETKLAGGYLTANSPTIAAFQADGPGQIGYVSGTLIHSIDENNVPKNSSQPAIGDIDGDGVAEIIVTGENQVWAYNNDGSLCLNFPVPLVERDLDLSSPVLGDLDGDGADEIILTTSAGNVEAYNDLGKMLEGFPLSFGGTAATPPALFDFDNDGDLELAAVSNTGRLSVWDLDAEYDPSKISWPFEKHDPAMTGFNPIKYASQTAVPGQSLLPENLAFNYPNPNIENYTIIRYRLNEPASVKIKIFDIMGDLVKEMDGPGDGPADHEVVWHLDDVDTGIYFGQIRAASGGTEKIVTIKIAVEK